MTGSSTPQQRPASISPQLWEAMGERSDHLSMEEALKIAERAAEELEVENKEVTPEDEAWFAANADLVEGYARRMFEQNLWFQTELTKVTHRSTMLVEALKKHKAETERLKTITEESILAMINPKNKTCREKELEAHVPDMLWNLSMFRQSLKDSLDDE